MVMNLKKCQCQFRKGSQAALTTEINLESVNIALADILFLENTTSSRLEGFSFDERKLGPWVPVDREGRGRRIDITWALFVRNRNDFVLASRVE
jgi:hypothetical protein